MTSRPMPPSARGSGSHGPASTSMVGATSAARACRSSASSMASARSGSASSSAITVTTPSSCCSMSTMTPCTSLEVTMSGRHVTLQRIARPRRLVASSTTSLPSRVAGQGVADRPAQLLDRQPDVEREQVLAGHLVGAQAPQVLGLLVPDLDRAARGRARRRRRRGCEQDRLEEGVDPVELVAALAQLVVDGLELLVGRLELLVHRLELLVGRLELLVGGLELLVGRLQLLVGGLELLVRRLQLLVGGLELALGALELAAQAARSG